MKLYKDQDVIDIPDIDAPGWIRIAGYSVEPPELQDPPAPSPVKVLEIDPPDDFWAAERAARQLIAPKTQSDALALINRAERPDEILVLPSIGKRASAIIFERRPVTGYSDLEQIWMICPELLNYPFKTNRTLVEEWIDDQST